MSLIVLIGPQAVGKMTIGKELEKRINGKLLFNHQTLDLYANFLGYTEETFSLSDQTRFNLFEAFVNNKETNPTDSIIFTVMIDFDGKYDIAFLEKIAQIFLNQQETVYFVALTANLETRLRRNTHEDRLKAKPSKQNLEFSKHDLLSSLDKYRLETTQEELAHLFPNVSSLTIDNTHLAPHEVAEEIITTFNLN